MLTTVELHGGTIVATDAHGHSVIDCTACGFAHFWPKPASDELATYYATAYYETHGAPDLVEKPEEQSFWELEYSDRLLRCDELLHQPIGRGWVSRSQEAAKVLDVGCGHGAFLQYASARGWNVLGIEPSAATRGKAARRGVPALLGTLEDVNLTGPQFDVVHAKLVLEHVLDPVAFLRRAASLLRPGGVICVEVPNDFNKLQMAACEQLKKPAWWVVYPVHVNYFNFDSLEMLLARIGFLPVRREGTYPMEWFLLQGLDYVGDDVVGHQCHEQRMRLLLSMDAEMRRSFAQWLAGQDIGREAVVYAIKHS